MCIRSSSRDTYCRDGQHHVTKEYRWTVHVQFLLVRRVYFHVTCKISLAANLLAADIAIHGSLHRIDE